MSRAPALLQGPAFQESRGGSALNYRGNLETHRNGSRQEDKSDKGCPGRNKAKLAGCILPPSVAKSRAAATRGGVDAS
ncbi:hypothetical protein MJO28_001011 [Puccinia striiformis f. sp. tritici]|uniref:Uncharacterized protein n=1 Tax=Puccinia striiformis f. sp. tritici TaxID=168172 RepID=A0ACC0EZL6_9BASI|nr:hypothetical protein MJO28_001011 [Puccinia striiformis f. sp. tritici]KAI9599976.1 hypothetical protein KEM48_000090 [Puccinia striiformis f. sp. tritici PST-130]